MNLHPGVVTALQRLGADELGVARMLAAGQLSSPQRYENIVLFVMRITGTGLSYRQSLDEHVWRDPGQYLNAEFLARCNGLAVVWEHPPNEVLNGVEFGRRVIGTVFIPFIQGDEVWAVVKIYDEEAARLMEEGQLSTSPAVVFQDATVNDRIQSDDGRSLLFEGKPSLLDHLAVCERGVWDKGGDPAGVRSDTQEKIMAKRADGTEEEMASEGTGGKDGEKLDKLLSFMDSVSKRLDAQDKRFDAMEAKKDADKKDGEEDDGQPGEKAKPETSRRADAIRRADEDAALAEVQSRADTAYNEWGKRAAKPLAGETVMAYRVRVLKDLQRFSPEFKAARLDLVAAADPEAFEAIERKVYADSAAEALKPTQFANDGITMRVKKDPETDRVTREFHGRHTYIRDMAPMARAVRQFADQDGRLRQVA